MTNIVPMGDGGDPFDHYEEYSDWLMKRYPICNGDDLVLHFEAATGFDEFLEERK